MQFPFIISNGQEYTNLTLSSATLGFKSSKLEHQRYFSIKAITDLSFILLVKQINRSKEWRDLSHCSIYATIL